MASSTPSILFQLPQELHDAIYALLEPNDIKSLRLTCSELLQAFPLRFDRVFISANSLNIQVFIAIANHEVFRHQVSEIIWDDARLPIGPELEVERRENEEEEISDEISDEKELATANDCPLWFIKGRYHRGDRGSWIYPDVHLGIKESWAYYETLLDDQRQVLSANADIEAFVYGLQRFTSLKRVTITPSTHGLVQWKTLYRTPMIRAFPAGFDYPLPNAWPAFNDNDDRVVEVLPWVSEDEGGENPYRHVYGDNPYQWFYGDECTAEVYRSKWRGFRLVMRALAEYKDHHITELVIGGNEVQSGLNCRIFDQRCVEYNDFLTLLKHPGFRYLDLHIFTGLIEEDDWKSLRTGLLHDALAQTKGMEHVCLRTSAEISDGVPHMIYWDPEGHVLPLRNVFPLGDWSRIRHFGISHLLVDLDDLVNLLSNLPSSLRSVELVHIAFGSREHRNGDLLRTMRDVLNWRSRPIGERPKVRMVVSESWQYKMAEKSGRYVEVEKAIGSYLYGTGDNPFEDSWCTLLPGRGGVRRDVFDSGVASPY